MINSDKNCKNKSQVIIFNHSPAPSSNSYSLAMSCSQKLDKVKLVCVRFSDICQNMTEPFSISEILLLPSLSLNASNFLLLLVLRENQ